MQEPKKNLLIWGTCVTRDAIAVKQYADITFVTRSSLASLGSAATDRFDARIADSKLSGWQQKVVKSDCHSDHRLDQRIADADLIVLDLMTEARGIFVEESSDVVVTKSIWFNRSIPNPEMIFLPSGGDAFFERWKIGADQFLQAVKKSGKPLVVNEVYWDNSGKYCFTVINCKVKKWVRAAAVNKSLKRLYGYLADSGCTMLRYKESDFRHSCQNKWGPAPFHFRKRFYKKLPAFLAAQEDNK